MNAVTDFGKQSPFFMTGLGVTPAPTPLLLSLHASVQYWTHLDSFTLLIAALYRSVPQFVPSVNIDVIFCMSMRCPCSVSCPLLNKCSLPVLASRLPTSVFTLVIIWLLLSLTICFQGLERDKPFQTIKLRARREKDFPL